jgi:hypothetical protein
MKTTQVELLQQLSSTDTIEKFIAAEREKRTNDLLSHNPNSESNALTEKISKDMLDSPEAKAFVAGFTGATLQTMQESKDDRRLKAAVIATVVEAFAMGFAYAASLIDSRVESVVN